MWVEEIDALYPGTANSVIFDAPLGGLSGAYPCRLICERIHTEGARSVARFGDDFYAGEPAITENRFGAGCAYYIATDPDPAVVRGLLEEICAAKGIRPPLPGLPAGVEAAQRVKDGAAFTFVLNHNAAPVTVTLPESRIDLLSGQAVSGETEIPAYGVLVLRSETA